MKRKVYLKPKSVIHELYYTEGIMREYSYSTDGGVTDLPIVDGNPDNPETGNDPYGSDCKRRSLLFPCQDSVIHPCNNQKYSSSLWSQPKIHCG